MYLTEIRAWLTLEEEDLHMYKKGKGVQNWGLLLKIATDIKASKNDYWFFLTGETFIKIKIKTLLIMQNACRTIYLYKKQLKHIKWPRRGRRDLSGVMEIVCMLIEVAWYMHLSDSVNYSHKLCIFYCVLLIPQWKSTSYESLMKFECTW